MTTPPALPAPPLRTWRPMALWSAAILAALVGLGACLHKPGASTTSADHKGTYIPKDLEDCFVQLKKILKPADIAKMKSGTEADMSQYHFGLGMWMRNNWGLWGGSRLAKWFNDQGIKHPDDMSGVILDSFWRHLNGRPINLDEQVKYYQDYWKQQKAAQPTSAGDGATRAAPGK